MFILRKQGRLHAHVVFSFHRPQFGMLTRSGHNQQLKVQHKNGNRKTYRARSQKRKEFRNIIPNNFLGMADTLKCIRNLQQVS